MKKLLLALICALAFVMPLTVKAETVAYTLTFYENYAYNLDTGVFSSTPGWSATNRMTVYEDEITINNAALVHHILFWDRNNTYIGYGNLSSNYEGSMYLGDFTASITIPAGVARFAFTSNNLGVNAPSGLGAYSYAQLFADPLYMDYVYPLFGETLTTIDTAYSINYLDYVDSVGVGTLTLTNLLQYGRFNSSTGWAASNATLTISDGTAKVTATSQYGRIFHNNVTLTNGQNYYISARIKAPYNFVYISAVGISLLAVYHSGSNNYETLSGIYNHALSTDVYEIVRTGDSKPSAWQQWEADDFQAFNSGSYTKSQIDSAISAFGYFPYNTAIEVPDVTDADYDGMLLDFTLTELSTWNGVITGIGSAETLDWLSICDVLVGDCTDVETFFGTASPAGTYSIEMTYLWQLLLDAQDEVPRWEWYSDKGITSGNYASYLNAYNTILTNYSTGITFANFDGLTVSYDRADVEPYVPATLLEGIEDYIDGFGLGTWAYIFISVAIMIVFAVILGLLHAPMMVMLIVEGALFLLFTIFGWFPVWLVIMVVIILFAILYKLLKGDGQSA